MLTGLQSCLFELSRLLAAAHVCQCRKLLKRQVSEQHFDCVVYESGSGEGHMAAVRALADLVHCPVASSSLQPTPFPLAEALQADAITKHAHQTAVLQSLDKARLPSLLPFLPVRQLLPGLHSVHDITGLCRTSCIVCQSSRVTVQVPKG